MKIRDVKERLEVRLMPISPNARSVARLELSDVVNLSGAAFGANIKSPPPSLSPLERTRRTASSPSYQRSSTLPFKPSASGYAAGRRVLI